MFSVWFACKTCRGSFKELNKFLEHKIQNHFEEFQNTERIIFDERIIQGNVQTLPSSTTVKEIGEANQQKCTEPPKFKIENENYSLSNPHWSDDTPQNVEFVKTEHRWSDQDGSVDGVDNFIAPKTEVTLNSEFNFQQPSLNTVYTTHNSTVASGSGEEDKILIFKSDLNVFENKIAAPKLNASSFSSDWDTTQVFIESRQNPFVLLRRLQYDHCPKQFCYESVLKLDAVTHTNKKNKQGPKCFKCPKPHCSKCFNFKTSIFRHIREVHSTSRSFKCSHQNCEKTFKGKSYLQKHLIMHTERETFKCPHEGCPKMFLRRQNIRLHIRNHSDPRPFKCTEADCEKTFTSNHGLTYHLASHSDARPFKCHHLSCEKTFKSKYILRRHVLKVHVKLRALNRSEKYCEKSYIDSNALRRHKIIHSESRLFKCHEIDCEKRYND